jgi:transcriptional regulator
MKGTANPSAKLTENDVDEIRLALARGEVQRKIASRFGVSQSQVSFIKRGLQWKKSNPDCPEKCVFKNEVF